MRHSAIRLHHRHISGPWRRLEGEVSTMTSQETSMKDGMETGVASGSGTAEGFARQGCDDGRRLSHQHGGQADGKASWVVAP
ncbi:unnamed protein product, partial [Ectocarpus sp. 12 AP-2014]